MDCGSPGTLTEFRALSLPGHGDRGGNRHPPPIATPSPSRAAHPFPQGKTGRHCHPPCGVRGTARERPKHHCYTKCAPPPPPCEARGGSA